MSEWQPIDTAPRDDRIMLAYADGFDSMSVGTGIHWLKDEWKCDQEETPVIPTHWMPLPEPPKG